MKVWRTIKWFLHASTTCQFIVVICYTSIITASILWGAGFFVGGLFMCMLSLLITIVEILMFLCMRFLLKNIFHTLNQTQ